MESVRRESSAPEREFAAAVERSRAAAGVTQMRVQSAAMSAANWRSGRWSRVDTRAYPISAPLGAGSGTGGSSPSEP
ncbi:hypothetical protein [Spongiactinospora gelatinilytica]|uniref:hypothetical protein n=1 Tax=Spongiactinospora gelatinilytica TaxID=2666298 RepID=UPI0011B93FCE|nr:hypothetical protein [Spongiactinospora gelatinilytica]